MANSGSSPEPTIGQPAAQPPLPQFDVHLTPPDLTPWIEGNTGIPGFTTRDSLRPGPHLALIALTHGNEIAGAIVLELLLRGSLWPSHGRITFGFVNLTAFARFDPRQPTASRFVEEDINRVWDPAVLTGPRRSSELDRAREIRPLIETVDILLDLHSMLWPSDPLLLSGSSEKGRRLALEIGVPDLVVADHGHASGRRLIDYPRFTDPDTASAAALVEAGQHWERDAVQMTLACIAGLLRHVGLAEESPNLPPPPPGNRKPRFAEVTMAVTATTGSFAFLQPFRGGDVIPKRNTLIAVDGSAEIRTPHDDCLLVMPSLRPSRGHTAVRLARFIG
jgi:predicted deacylase